MNHAIDADDIVDMAAHRLSAAIRARRVSCREVMQAYLERIETHNPRVNAIVSLRDPEVLLREASACDTHLARGRYLGWLHGIPQAIKDLADAQGLRTTQGSPLFAGQIARRDAPFVARTRRAGAIVIGKTNTPEFGLGSQTYNPVFGATGCAYAPDLTAGGSSGGAAAAVAMRLLPVADGSDMMGSLRNPAAFNNLFGFRPSYARVPGDGEGELYLQQLSCTGAIGRRAADVALLLATQAGYHRGSPLSIAAEPAVLAAPQADAVAGKRLAWMGDWNAHLPLEPGIAGLCGEALRRFDDLGVIVEQAGPDFSPQRLWETWLTLRHWLVCGSLHPLYADPERRALLKPEARWEIEGGLRLSALDVYRASAARSDWYRALDALFARYDFVALPSAQVFAFDKRTHWPVEIAGVSMDTYHRWMEVVIPATLAGCPVVNLPAGFDPRGRAMGIQVIARHLAERDLLQLARAWEAVAPWIAQPPPGG